jgi:hypothetical protein
MKAPIAQSCALRNRRFHRLEWPKSIITAFIGNLCLHVWRGRLKSKPVEYDDKDRVFF